MIGEYRCNSNIPEMRFDYQLQICTLGIAAMVATSFQSAQALSAREVGKIAQGVTVRIEGQNPGSGVLVKKQGETYTVLTAAHVVETEDEYEIITHDGQSYPLDYQRVNKFSGVDLALVEFESPTDYIVAQIGDSTQALSGTPIFVSGFPAPTTAITDRVFNFTQGSITANAKRPLADGYALVYSNSTLPGMSGGAVLDEQGSLIGIHGRADAEQQQQLTGAVYLKTGFNLGIPISTYLSFTNQGKTATSSPSPSISESAELTADDWFLRAEKARQQNDNKAAIEYYTRAIRLNADYASAYNNRGLLRQNFNDNKGAIADFEKAIQLNPDDSFAYNNRGNALSELGEREGAIADYSKAIQLNPVNAGAYYNRGIDRYRLGDNRGAIADFEKTIQLNPDNALAYNNRGNALSELGVLNSAIADYDKAIQLNPDYPGAYYNRGNTRFRLSDPNGAIADYDKAIQLNLDHARAYYNRAIARRSIGDRKGAIADITEAARLYKKKNNRKDYENAMSMLEAISP